MPNNELQELLGARFKEHTHPTNESVWGAIEAQLDAKQSDRFGIWFWIFNGIAASLLIGIIFQSGLSSTIHAKSTNIELTEETLKESPSPEAKDSNLPENGTFSEATATINTERNSLLENGKKQEVLFTNQVDKSTTASRMSPTESKVEQFVSLPEASTNFDGGIIVTTSTRAKNTSVDDLSTRPLTFRIRTGAIENDIPSISTANKNGYFKRLPIHLGAEFTYLHRDRVPSDALTGIDSSYTPYNDVLAYNRHFEFSLFSQFDFTSRFSASAGLGYSYSIVGTDDGVSNANALTAITKSSKLNLFTVPLQSKFTLLQRKRIALNAGLTFQGEFGRIEHTEKDAFDSSVASTSVEELVYQSPVVSTNKIRQFAFEPFLQASVNISPRISVFANAGYRMYLNQPDAEVAPIGRLSYFNTDVGLLVRLK